MTSTVEINTVETAESLSIGQVSERTGLSVHALRFYEREGLFTGPVQRNAGGRRVYGEHDIEWLTVCIKLRASGMPLPAIRRYAELVHDGLGNEPQRIEIMREHRERVIAQIAELTECLNLISSKIGVYEGLLTRDEGCLTWENTNTDREPAS